MDKLTAFRRLTCTASIISTAIPAAVHSNGIGEILDTSLSVVNMIEDASNEVSTTAPERTGA